MDEDVDVGIFSAEPGKKGFKPESVLRFERLRIRSGTQTLKFVLAKEPSHAGIDPYNKRIDRNSDDNTVAVNLQQ